MNILLRESQNSDLPFLREMLYLGVFWRAIANNSTTRPSLQEGLECPGVSEALVDWGERDGDVAIVAVDDSIPVGAAWFRFYNIDNCIRGYIEDTIPALVIAIRKDYRRQGIGKKLINWLVDHASKQNIQNLSLMVSKDNHAIHLYRKCGFLEYADTGDSLIMIRKIQAKQMYQPESLRHKRLQSGNAKR